MLPGVKVLKFASTPPNDDDLYNSDKSDDPMYFDEESLNATVERGMESNLIRIEVGSANEHSMPTMTSGDLSSWQQKLHRCGVPVEIVRGPEVIGKATIGGLITVGDEVYGLTVGHLFSSSTEHNEEAQQSLDTWQEWLVCGMDFDWALIRIPGLHEEDVKSWENVNLVQTVSGEFRPVLVALEEPSPYTHVIIATPGSTRCLRGVFIGPGAIVNIPESPTPYATWVCRMELPWLIQPGDSGSWVLDAGNGMLMGVLVAGCPELQEAYFIPAHEIFDDIRQHYPDRYPDMPRLRSDGDIMLFAVKLTEKNNRFLVVLPPPSVGPSKSIQPWPSARDYPAYARSNRHIAFSAWRLPFMLTDKSTPEEECLELLLSTQLNIDIGALKQRWKLDLRDEHSRFYLKEYNKYVDVVIYEGHVEDQSFVSPKMIHGPTGWMMQMMDEASARKHLSPPFSAILYPPIPDEQNIN
ncbi:hypothetical protein FPSE5266_04012 [Fusarium pseudograminearum]|nr:hypothetical protein FPSE5266_04012 [Fusarium pseudograminearum]